MPQYNIEVVQQEPYIIELQSTGCQGPAGASNVFETRDVAVSGDVLVSDVGIRASGTITLTMPTAVGIEGQFFRVKNVGVGTVTMATTGGQTIDGVSTFGLLSDEALVLRSNGSNWEIW